MCANCLDKNNLSSQKYFEKIKSNDPKRYAEILANRSVQQCERRKQRVAQGVCTLCGKRPAKSGRKSCELCLYKERIRRRANYIEHGQDPLPRHERPAYGLCYICLEPVKNGYRLCEKCYTKRVRNMPTSSTKNHIWRKANQIIGVRNEQPYEFAKVR